MNFVYPIYFHFKSPHYLILLFHQILQISEGIKTLKCLSNLILEVDSLSIPFNDLFHVNFIRY